MDQALNVLTDKPEFASKGQASSSTGHLDWFTATFILVTWIAISPLLVPVHLADRDIFVFVGDRLLAGDTLYADVYDNKDPLFYYFVAAQRSLGSFGEIAFEFLLVIVAGISSFYLAQEITTKRSTAAGISFVAVPIIVTGAFYYPGYDHLPGISLSLAACASSARRRVTISGVCLGLLVFTKLIMVPAAIAAVVCILHGRNRLYQSYKLLLVAGIIVVVMICVLLARSEFWPFIHTISENVKYSQTNFFIDSSSILILIASHINRISSLPFFTLLFSCFLSCILSIIILHKTNRKKQLIINLFITSLITITVTLIVLMITGLWQIHNQILYFPSILIAICLTSVIETSYPSTKSVLMLCFITSLAFLLGGGPDLRKYLHSRESIVASVKMLNGATPAAQRLLALGPKGSYARLGSNDDGSPLGLNSWKLVCPRFHQWPFQSSETLHEVLLCASTAETLVVAKSVRHLDGNQTWNQFVDSVEDLLRSYNCDADSGLRVCTRVVRSPSRQ